MLVKLGEFIKKQYKLVLILCGLFTLVSIYWISQLKLTTQMMDMLPADQPEVVAYQDILDNFTGIDTISIAVEGNESDVRAYIEDVAGALEKIEHVDRVIYKSETEFLRKHGFLLVENKDLNSLSTMLTASSVKDFVKGLNDNFETVYIESEDTDKLSKDKLQMLTLFNTVEDFLYALRNPAVTQERVSELADNFLIGPAYMISPDRSMGLVFVRTSIAVTDIDNLIPLVNTVESLVKEQQQAHNVKAGVSGFLVLQRDEMVHTTSDMNKSFLISIILILVIFLVGFRLLRYSVLAVIPLIIGIIWAMGLAYVIYGSLNLFTAMMGAILIGLGIDYAIHIMALYTEERNKGTGVSDALTMVFRKTVKGIVTGSVTTAIGFTMFGFSSFPAYQEFGVTLGLGILCILAASILILPCLLIIFGRKPIKRRKPIIPIMPLFRQTVMKQPWIIISLFVIVSLICAYRFKDIQFTVDLKAIEPKGLESIVINDKLIDKFDFSTDQSLGVTATLEQTHQLKEDAEDLGSVGIVESLANYIPLKDQQEERIMTLRKIKGRVDRSVDRDLHLNELAQELYRLRDNIIELSDLAYISGERKIVEKCDQLINDKVMSALADNINAFESSIKTIQAEFISHLQTLVRKSNDNRKITLDDVPASIKEAYIGKDGRYLTTIFPKGDVWSDAFQPLYFADINSLGVPLTGTSILSLKVMTISGQEGKKILLWVLIAIFIVLIIDFRSLKYAVLAMIPMGLTLVLLIGSMAIFGKKFDFVNIIALPIIIGIGVDDGVHLIHRYLIEKQLIPTVKSTGRAILLTTLTTMAAFGTLMISTYRGFASFGLALVMGIGFAYLLTMVLLTALIRVMERKK
ncbi:RND family transporter [Thermoproteota archaeon]